MRRIALVIVSILLGGTGVCFAEQAGAVGSKSAHARGSPEEKREHEHGPRHGGIFGDAGDLFHYELVLESPSQLRFYVNDSVNLPLDTRTLQAKWRLNPDSSNPILGSFASAGDGASFSATLPMATTDEVHIEVSVLRGTEWVPMEFFLPVPKPKPKSASP